MGQPSTREGACRLEEDMHLGEGMLQEEGKLQEEVVHLESMQEGEGMLRVEASCLEGTPFKQLQEEDTCLNGYRK